MTSIEMATMQMKTHTVRGRYQMLDATRVSQAPALNVNAKEGVILVAPRAYGSNPIPYKKMGEDSTQYIFALEEYSMNEAAVNAKKFYDSATDADKAIIDKFVAEVLVGEVDLYGKNKVGSRIEYSKHEIWWLFQNNLTMFKTCKEIGVCEQTSGIISNQSWSRHRLDIFKDNDDRFGVSNPSKKARLEYDQKSNQFSTSSTVKNILVAGHAIMNCPVYQNNVEPNMHDSDVIVPKNEQDNMYWPGLPKSKHRVDDFGHRLFTGGCLTAYYIQPLDEKKAPYRMVLCENYYGQLFACNGSHRYENYRPIGRVMEILSTKLPPNPTKKLHILKYDPDQYRDDVALIYDEKLKNTIPIGVMISNRPISMGGVDHMERAN